MPKTPMDYSKTIIYKLVCKDINITDLYVGQTRNFIKRKAQHKNCYSSVNNKSYNLNVYKFIRDNGGWNNWDMIEIEKYPCNDVNEANKRERYWIETLKASLNKIIPSRNSKEWYEDNKQYMTDYSKYYRSVNKEEIKEKKKIYYDNNKEDIQAYDKVYREINNERIKDKLKQYYQMKKQDILHKIQCGICNCMVNKSSLLRHQKTTKHQNNLIKVN